MSTREDDLDELRQLLRSTNENVNLPAALSFYRRRGAWEIEMGPKQVIANLQTDAAAFEGWALAIKRWAGAEERGLEVHLRWKPPRKVINGSSKHLLHYERFLYRVIRFKENVDWFKVARGCNEHLEKSKVLTRNGKPKNKEAVFLVNVPGERTEHKVSKASNALRMSERDIEIWFRRHPKQLLESIGWGGKLKRQVPVGIFDGKITSGKRVFPGASGKVDLAATDSKKGVALFELKKPGNSKIGALSELLYYTHVIRDIGTVFSYRPEDMGEFEDAIASATRVRGFMLATELHPLLDKEVFGLLKKAFGGTGKAFGFVQYDEGFNCEQKWPKQ